MPLDEHFIGIQIAVPGTGHQVGVPDLWFRLHPCPCYQFESPCGAA